jgi:hypothetical protein
MSKVELPLSRHDLRVLKNVIAEADIHRYKPPNECEDDEIVISSKRVSNKFKVLSVYGIRIRLSDEFKLNEGLFIRQGQGPISFDFESERV